MLRRDARTRGKVSISEYPSHQLGAICLEFQVQPLSLSTAQDWASEYAGPAIPCVPTGRKQRTSGMQIRPTTCPVTFMTRSFGTRGKNSSASTRATTAARLAGECSTRVRGAGISPGNPANFETSSPTSRVKVATGLLTKRRRTRYVRERGIT